MARIIYLPLEPYIERYTWYLSCKNGWAETHFKELGISFERVEGEGATGSVQAGLVLDAYGRSIYAMSQVTKVCEMLRAGSIQDDDVIYTEDFWHPGIESLFYIRDITKIKFKVGAFIHAQTVDDWDFTARLGMTRWMRDIEKGFSQGYDFVFTSSTLLQRRCADAGIVNVHWVGHCFHSKRLLEQTGIAPAEKERFVLFSSRMDPEKDPMFLVNLAQACPGVNFVIANPRRVLTYDDAVIAALAKTYNIAVVNTYTKQDYYALLATAKVQFNCSHQDWVSYVLLEAILYKCNPLYPMYRDFPSELDWREEYLYEKGDVSRCADKLYQLLELPWNPKLDVVLERHDNTWFKMATLMEVLWST